MGFFDKLFGQSSNPWLIQGNDLRKGRSIEGLREAITCYNKAIETDPKCVEAWHNKGHCYKLLRNDEEAIQCFDEAIKINPNYAEVWYNKGMCLESLHGSSQIFNGGTESQKCLKKAIEIDSRYKRFIENRYEPKVFRPDGTMVIKKFPPDPRKWSK